MNSQSPYVDANYSYVDVTKSFDMNVVSANPSLRYAQKPMQNNLYASNPYNISNVQHIPFPSKKGRSLRPVGNRPHGCSSGNF